MTPCILYSSPPAKASKKAKKKPKPLCIVCSLAPARRNWRCQSCSNYFDRKGTDRPSHLLDRALHRSMAVTPPR